MALEGILLTAKSIGPEPNNTTTPNQLLNNKLKLYSKKPNAMICDLAFTSGNWAIDELQTASNEEVALYVKDLIETTIIDIIIELIKNNEYHVDTNPTPPSL